VREGGREGEEEGELLENEMRRNEVKSRRNSPLPLPHPSIPKLSRPREELSILVQRDRHDSIGCVESFLDSISVMNVDVDVEHSFVVAEEFENSQDDVCGGWVGERV